MRLVFYISGHGFGHTSRSVELIKALACAVPSLQMVVKTAAPRWLFESVAGPSVAVEAFEADTGIIQIDSLNIDERESLRRAVAFYDGFDMLVEREAAYLRDTKTAGVLSDIPPLAHAAAARAGVPSIAIGNFTWDWIYAAYESFACEAPQVIEVIRQAYAQTMCALRLPIHGGFEPMIDVTRDIPFIARRSTRERADTRRALSVPGDRPFVLASFGAYGLAAAYEKIARAEHLTIFSPGGDLPAGMAYQDIVAAADLVVSKPGYGIVSECAANGTPLLYTSRGRFVEYDLFVAEMPRVLRCRFIPQEDVMAGRWRSHIEALLQQPPPPEQARIDGTDVAVKEILASL